MQDTLDWLYGLKRFGSKLGLDRIKEAVEFFNNPQDKIEFIHIAGTNGKGSTSVMIQSILTEAGYKVGRYNSPHIIDFRERISIDNKWITQEELLKLIEKVKSSNIELTFFEFTTVMALLYFKENNVDYVVLETGLGGRFDATNVVNAKYCVITNIALEHTKELGDTLDKIAHEKAGIINNDSIVFYAGTNSLSNIFDKGKEFVIIQNYESSPYHISLKGIHQQKNVLLAVKCINKIDSSINRQTIQKALNKISWPGRLETLGKFILDCAHNPAGLKTIQEYFDQNPINLTIVFGVLKDKDYLKMLQLLPKHNKLIITKPNSKRGLEPEILASYSKECIIVNDIAMAVDKAYEYKEIVLIIGSCYVISDARKHILKKFYKTLY